MSHEKPITSRHNEQLKLARAVRDGRNRNYLFIEGVRLSEDALRANLSLEYVFMTPQCEAKSPQFAAALKQKTARYLIVEEQLFSTFADTAASPGVILLARRSINNRQDFDAQTADKNLFLALHRLNNPSNAGAILRVAEAAGAAGIIATNDTTDVLSPKALRGAMGASFRLPLWLQASFADLLEWARARELQIICADVGAQQSHWATNLARPTLIILGSEAHGLSADEAAQTDLRLHIPMLGQTESLNVAVAAGIILYEAARQRRGSDLRLDTL